MWKLIRNIVITLVVFLLLTAVLGTFSTDKHTKPVQITEIVGLVSAGKVESVDVDQDKV
ncbi:MAG: hypothetical protein JNK33_05145, partial [Candidatus Doudnabacteria bacterium]|nr:hypothetical protein [Candidatus Doudnabacteria bacterium]